MDGAIARLGLALAIGLLVGLERGWQERNAPDRSRTAGIRTFGISGLLGGVIAALSQAVQAPAVLVAGFLGFAAVLSWYKAREAAHDEDFSVTGVVAGLGVFSLGHWLSWATTVPRQLVAAFWLRPWQAGRFCTGCFGD
ncbi:MgtC/SapB family protein [Aminobacter sp. BA135]|uniref:MgtC/SapB family protein n=1 Tax=Aminobacter sp. BA135 TaxID=537596 RepID=UPI003D7A2E90